MNAPLDPAKHAASRFSEPMKPCPKCGSWNFRYQTPIKMAEPVAATDGARQILGKWARAVKGGATPLQGPVFIMCFDCAHKGPALDCSGRTSEEVGRDREVASTVRRLWNEQAPTKTSVEELKQKIDALSPRSKDWLRTTAQQLNDSDASGYVDDEQSRKECVAAGIITQLRGSYIEMTGEVNELLYTQGYLENTQMRDGDGIVHLETL